MSEYDDGRMPIGSGLRSNFENRPTFGCADGLGGVGWSDINGGDGQAGGLKFEAVAVCSQNGMNCCQDSVIVLIRVVEYGRLTPCGVAHRAENGAAQMTNRLDARRRQVTPPGSLRWSTHNFQ